MSLLSDYHIKCAMAAGALVLKPTPPNEAIQASSVDLRLGRHFRVYDSIGPDIDPFAPPEMHLVTPNEGTAFRLQPQQFVLGHTEEFVTLGDGLAGQVDGKSTLGRLGLLVHCTAGFIDPGFTGQVTLEFYNAAPRPILLWPGMQVCQLVLHRVSSTVTRPYGSDGLGSRYQNSIGAVPPRGDYIRLREPA